MILPSVFVSICLTFLAAAGARAQPAADAAADPSRRSGVAVRLADTDAAPRIDGRLDDPVWSRAVPLSDFVQRRPSQGRPSAMRTVARLAVDDYALYAAVEAFDPEPERVVGRLTRRDEFSSGSSCSSTPISTGRPRTSSS